MSTKINTRAITKWIGTVQRIGDSYIRLVADGVGDESQQIAEWTHDQLVDIEAWSVDVAELAQSDAEARGISTRYALQHVVDGRTRQTHPIRVKVESERESTEATLDGSTASIITQLQRHLERSNAQLGQLAGNAVNTTERAMQALARSYVVIEQQQRTIAEQAAKLAKREKPASEAEEPDQFVEFIKTVVAHKMGLPEGGASSAAKKPILDALGLPEDTDLKKVGAMLRLALAEPETQESGH